MRTRIGDITFAMPRSYVPDNDGETIFELLDGRTESPTGIHKLVEIHLNPNRLEITLTHTLINEGLWEMELAPWAITMFHLGGTEILPIQVEHPDVEALLPNRNISLWAYSKVNDPRLHFEDGFIMVNVKTELPLFKIGTFNPLGWMAYWIDGILFRKTFNVQPGQPHSDYGCNDEIYCDEHFIELESLAPLKKLAPGDSTGHIETWELYDSLEQDLMSAKAVELVMKATT